MAKVIGTIKPERDFPIESELAMRIHSLIDEYREEGPSQVSVIGILEMIKDDIMREAKE